MAQLLERVTSSEERVFLSCVSEKMALHATLLPIYSVGVQVDSRYVKYEGATKHVIIIAVVISIW